MASTPAVNPKRRDHVRLETAGRNTNTPSMVAHAEYAGAKFTAALAVVVTCNVAETELLERKSATREFKLLPVSSEQVALAGRFVQSKYINPVPLGEVIVKVVLPEPPAFTVMGLAGVIVGPAMVIGW